MAKIKLTKTELKAQRDALARFQRFLPMLQLKKQQLQLEISTMRTRVEDAEREREALLAGAAPWLGLLADESAEIPVVLERVRTGQGNIAGVAIPVYEGVDVSRPEIDLFATPAWVDEAVEAGARLIGFAARIDVLREQITRIEAELRTTSQRVNLFEKVKIPECRENIRLIGIALGDEQTSGVARGKIAKSRDKGGEPAQRAEEGAA